MFAWRVCSYALFLWRTKWGYEIRATGSNPSAAECGGISVKRQIVLAMAVSGARGDGRGQRSARLSLPLLRRLSQTTVHRRAVDARPKPSGWRMVSAVLFGMMIRGGIFVDAFTNNVTKDR